MVERAVPVTPRTPAQKALDALGKPQRPQDVEESVKPRKADGGKWKLDLQELGSIWGITSEQLKGLTSLGVVWKDGINEAELGQIIKFKMEVWKDFYKIFRGTGKSEAVLEELFDRLWGLAMKGELDLDNWDALMEEYGLEDYEMNSSSFSALLAGEKGKFFSDDERVEGILELGQAFSNLILTMLLNFPPTGNEERDEYQVKKYAKAFKQHCSSRNFNMIYLDKWAEAVKQVLKTIDAKVKITLSMIKNQKFGKQLGELAKLARDDWNNFLVLLLRVLERSLEEDMDTENMNLAQYYLLKSKRMSLINEVVQNGSEDRRWKALVEELVSVFKGDKLALDYKRVKEETMEKEEVKA